MTAPQHCAVRVPPGVPCNAPAPFAVPGLATRRCGMHQILSALDAGVRSFQQAERNPRATGHALAVPESSGHCMIQ
jgi:hypothetical protein